MTNTDHTPNMRRERGAGAASSGSFSEPLPDDLTIVFEAISAAQRALDSAKGWLIMSQVKNLVRDDGATR